jgi:hypothetical protein
MHRQSSIPYLYTYLFPSSLSPTLAQTDSQVLFDLDAYTSTFSIDTAKAVADTFAHGIASSQPSPIIVSAIAWAAPAAQ